MALEKGCYSREATKSFMRVLLLVSMLMCSLNGHSQQKNGRPRIEVAKGRMGITRQLVSPQNKYTIEVEFNPSGGNTNYVPRYFTFCGNLEKGLFPYWFKLVHIKFQPTEYGCARLISIVRLKEPVKKKSTDPRDRVW